MPEGYEDLNEPYSNPNVNPFESYDEDALEHVFKQGEFENWDEVLEWLHNYGGEDNYLHPGKVTNMHDDIIAIRDAGRPFSTDANEVYEMIRNYRENMG